ncbi:MAG TPA: hypothetical protein VE988_21140 [Gemmataceae bacterium]|nr:hypothetical protein [Gemmataceae bacterium]
MKKSAWRLALSAILFAAWIGYLAYLAATTTDPIVLSRPQFLDADLYVVADVNADATAPDQPVNVVSIKKVIWARNEADKQLKTLPVLGLRTAKDLESELKKELETAEKSNDLERKKGAQKKLELEKKFIWQGAGEYILALSRSKGDPNLVTVTALPRTPGFAGYAGRIYPATPTTIRQLELLTKEYHP